jgi:hypothetical protein
MATLGKEMQMIRSPFAYLAATAALLMMFAAPPPADATLVVDDTFVYNFNSLAAGNLVGQDNWTGANGGTTVGAAEAGFPTSGQRILGGSNTTGIMRRTNNGAFNFSILDDVPRFDLEFLQTHGDSGIAPNTGQALLGLSTSGVTEFYFGLLPPPSPAIGVINRPHWGIFNGATFNRDAQDQDNGGWVGGGGAIWRYRLQVDQFGSAGPGTAKASFFRTSIAPNTFAPVGTEVAEPDLQNITLTGLPALSSINQLYVQIGDFTRMDNLTVTTFELIPEPSTLLLFVVGLLAMVVVGWRYKAARGG